jgi:hypothetical protein
MSSLQQRKLRQIAIVSRALAHQDGIDCGQTSRRERHQYRREAIITLLGNWTLDDLRLADGIIDKCLNG